MQFIRHLGRIRILRALPEAHMARLCDSTLRNIQPSGFSGCYSIMRTRGGRVYMYSIYVQISVGVKSVQIAVMGVQ